MAANSPPGLVDRYDAIDPSDPFMPAAGAQPAQPQQAQQGPTDRYDQPDNTPRGQNPPPPQGYFGPEETAMIQGASFGFGDEITAGIRSLVPGNPSYDELVKQERDAYKNYTDEHPWKALGWEAVGGAPWALATGGGSAAASAARVAPSLLRNRVLTSAAGGAAQGALTGAGTAEGGIVDRAKGAVGGAAIGGGIGAAAPIAGEVLRFGGRVGQDFFGTNPGATAERKILQAFQRDNVSPEEIRIQGLLDTDPRMWNKKREIVADKVPGGSVSALTEALVQQPGPTKRAAKELMDRRAEGQSERVIGDLRDVFGKRIDYYDQMDNLIADRKAASVGKYQTAYAHGAVPDPEIAGILKRLPNEVFGQAKEALQMDGRDLPRAFIRDADGNLTLNTQEVPDVEFLDYVKRGIDRVIDSETDGVTGKVTGRGRDFIGMKNELLTKLDKAVPAYAEARAAYAGPSSLMRAMEVGRNLFNDQWQHTRREIADMSAGEKDAFINGVSDALLKRVDDVGDGRDVSRSIWGNETKRKQVREAIVAVEPDKKKAKELFQRLDDNMQAEREMAATRNRLMGGSPTAPRTAAMEDLNRLGPAGIELATGGSGIGMAAGAVGSMFRKGGLLSRHDAVNKEAGQMLLSSTPADHVKFMNRLIERERGMGENSRQVGLLTDVGAGMASQAGARKFAGILNIPDEPMDKRKKY